MKIYYPQKPTLINIKGSLFQKLEEDPNVVAELKYNGTRLVLQKINGEFEFWNRHGVKLKYAPSDQLLWELKSLNWTGFTVLDGELLHTKVKSTKHQVVVYDVIVVDGKEVIKKPFSKRREILEDHFKVDGAFEKLFFTTQWRNGWQEVYDEMTKIDYIEGLVMKRLDAPAKLGVTGSPVVATMWKVRKATKNYRY